MKKAVQLRTLWGDQSKARCILLHFERGASARKGKCFVIPSRHSMQGSFLPHPQTSPRLRCWPVLLSWRELSKEKPGSAL